ncbi:hypothetical protein ILUMI_25915 [Ignelater luminosus]|uniref:Uncharacterized protein n=1 Tax=Ignelater luminosus TaxID=2038154 RepID=A0A8K0C4T9_IGNLU|nr:hypothetical protein ILUMI_25915 [Ignelater luminosus]
MQAKAVEASGPDSVDGDHMYMYEKSYRTVVTTRDERYSSVVKRTRITEVLDDEVGKTSESSLKIRRVSFDDQEIVSEKSEKRSSLDHQLIDEGDVQELQLDERDSSISIHKRVDVESLEGTSVSEDTASIDTLRLTEPLQPTSAKITPTELSSSFTDVTSQVSVKSHSASSTSVSDVGEDVPKTSDLGEQFLKSEDLVQERVSLECLTTKLLTPTRAVEITVDDSLDGTYQKISDKRAPQDEKLYLKRESLDECFTSDDVSQVSSLHFSDSTKFSETDAEPVSSETDSSFKVHIESMSDRSFSSKPTGTTYQVTSPHSECSESHVESIIETTQYDMSKPEIQHKRSVPYDVGADDIVMTDDVLEITMHQKEIEKPEEPQSMYIVEEPEEVSEKITTRPKIHKMRAQTTTVKKHTVTRKTISQREATTAKTVSFSSPSPRLKALKVDSDADVSSDEEKIKEDRKKVTREKVFKKTSTTTGSSTFESKKRFESHIPRYTKKSSKPSSSDSVSTDTSKVKERDSGKRKSKSKPAPISTVRESIPAAEVVGTPKKKFLLKESTPVEPSTSVVKKYDTRVHGYMQSTLSRDLKIGKGEIQKRAKEMINVRITSQYEQKKVKDKHETENINEKTKLSKLHLPDKQRLSTPEKKPASPYRHAYERQTISSEQKVSSREGTPVKSIEKKAITSDAKDTRASPKYKVKTTTVEGKGLGHGTLKADLTSAKMHIAKTRVISKSEVSYDVQGSKSTKTLKKSDVSSLTRVSSSKTRIKLTKDSSTITHDEKDAVRLQKVKVVPQTQSPKQIPSPPKFRRVTASDYIRRESPSPTKIRRATPVDQIRKDLVTEEPSIKPSEFERTVQISDRERSQSVIPTTSHLDKTIESQLIERSLTPTSLPGSPVRRVRSANGGTQVITSEVFKRTHDLSGSIEVIYRQPHENLKKVPSGIRTEGELSLIDTTDSSLSESVALPSSLSDHDMSSDANGRLKSTSPTSPKTKKSLESIHEVKHRVSDLVMYTETLEDFSPETMKIIKQTTKHQTVSEEACISLPRQLLMSQYEERTEAEKYSQELVSKEQFLPVLDISETITRKTSKKSAKSEEKSGKLSEWDASGKPSAEGPVTTKGTPVVDAVQQGISTSTTKPLASHEDKLPDAKIIYTQPITGLSIVQDVLSNDLKPVIEQTNALILSESRPEPYNETTRKLVVVPHESRRDKVVGKVKEKSVSRDSSREDEKKSKKGFFGTLKTFVGKSLESDSSESEKSPKKEKKKKDKKRKKPKDKAGLPPEPPTRPSRKPRLPTPPETVERKEFADIPYMEDLALSEKPPELPQTEPPLLENGPETKIPTDIKDQAHEIIDGVITDGKSAATQIIDQKKSPSPKKKLSKITVAEEVTKTFEPSVIEDEDFRIEVDPNKKLPQKTITETVIFTVDDQTSKLEKEVPLAPTRPPRVKAHVYEEIDNKVPTDIKLATTYLIQNEIYFTGWSDDKHNVHKPQTVQKVQEISTDTPKTARKAGGFLSLFGKKSSKDVEESDEDRSDSIIEKHDKELSKESTTKDKPQTPKERKKKKKAESDESESEDQKRGGFFGKFKKTKKSVEPCEQIAKPEVKQTIEEVQTPKSAIIISEDTIKAMDNSKNFLTEEVSRYHDVRPIVKSPEQKEKQPEKKEVVKVEETEIPPSLSQEVAQQMKDSQDFLEKEVTKFEDVKPLLKVKETKSKDDASKSKDDAFKSKDKKDDSQEEKKGIFVIFGKKAKKEEEPARAETKLEVQAPLPTPSPISEEVLQQIYDTKNFISVEIAKYEDVSPSKPKTPAKPLLSDTPQTKESKAESDDESRERKKSSGLFNIFGKKSKKDEVAEIEETIPKDTIKLEEAAPSVPLQLSEEIQQQMSDTTNFLNEEVDKYEDAKLIKLPEPADEVKEKEKKQAIEESKKGGFFGIFGKKPKKEDVVETAAQPVLSQEVVKQMSDSKDFLQEEIARFEDVMPLQKQPSPVKVKESAITKTDEAKTQKQPSPSKRKERKGTDSDDETKERRKSGLFGLFTKKTTEEKIDKEDEPAVAVLPPVVSKELQKEMDDTSKFLKDEVDKYEDVKLAKSKSPLTEKKDKDRKAESDDEDKDQKKGLFGIFGKKSKREESVERKIAKELEDKKPTDQEVITKEIDPSSPLLQDVKQQMSDSSEFLKEEVARFEDVMPIKHKEEKKDKEKKVESDDEGRDQKKSGLFGLFGKKSKREESIPKETEEKVFKVEEPALSAVPPPPLSQEVVQQMTKTADFVKEEIARFEDVMPVRVKEPSEKKQEEKPESDDEDKEKRKSGLFGLFGKKSKRDESIERKLVKETEEKLEKRIEPQQLSEDVVQQMTESKDFLKEEISRFEDVMPIKAKKREEKLESDDEEKEKRKSGLFGLFGKKPKQEESVEQKTENEPTLTAAPPQVSHEIVQQMAETTDFLKEEVSRFEDVMPIKVKEPSDKKKEEKFESDDEEKEKRKSGLFGLFGKKSKKEESVERKSPKDIEEKVTKQVEPALSTSPVPLSQDVVRQMDETTDFLKEEISRFEDVRLVKQKEPSDKTQEGRIEFDDEEKEKRKSGLFGLFGKKPKREESVERKVTTEVEEKSVKHVEPVVSALASVPQQQILVAEDVLKEKVTKLESTTLPKVPAEEKKDKDKKIESDDEEKEKRKSGLFGLFGKKSKREDSVERKAEKPTETISPPSTLSPEVAQQPLPDSTDFLKEEIERFHDVMPSKPIISEKSDVEKHKTAQPEKASPEKKLKDKQIEADEEGKDQKKTGLFGIFGKKSKREDSVERKVEKPTETISPPPSSALSPEVAQQPITDSSDFLKEEIERYHDVMPSKPIIIPETHETAQPERASPEKKLKDKQIEADEEGKDQKKTGLFGIFGKKSKREDSVERKTEKPTETVSPPPSILSPEVQQPITDSSDFLKEEIERYHDVMPSKPTIPESHVEKRETVQPERASPEKKLKDKQIEADEEGKDQKKSGLFGIFGKKSKRDDSVERKVEKSIETISPPSTLSPEVAQQPLPDSSDFLKEEFERYHDVMPSKPIIPEKSDVEKHETAQLEKASPEKKLKDKQVEPDEEGKDQKKAGLFGIFGKKSKREDSVERKIESVPSKPSEDVIQQMPDTSRSLKQEIEELEGVTLEKEKLIDEVEVKKLEIDDENKDLKKGGLFGLFTKKSKREDSVEKKIEKELETAVVPLSQEVIQQMKDSQDFLKEEVARYDDVKPVKLRKRMKEKKEKDRKSDSDDETRERRRSGLLGLFGKKSAKEGSVELPEQTASQEDAKKEVEVEKQDVPPTETPKPTASKLSSEDKKEKHKKAESDDEHKERKKSGIFSVFGKKPKKEDSIERKAVKDTEVAETSPPQDVQLQMKDSTDFLKEEIARFEDVMPSKLQIREVQKTVEAPPLSKDVLQQMSDSNSFLHEEISRYEDSRPLPLEKVQRKDKAKKVEFDLEEKPKQEELSKHEDIMPTSDEKIEGEPAVEAVTAIMSEVSVVKEVSKPDDVSDYDVREVRRPVEVVPQVPPAVTDDTLRKISDTENFLNREISVFEDVIIMPTQRQDETYKSVEPTSDQTESLLMQMLDTATFINEEILRYDHAPSTSATLKMDIDKTPDIQVAVPLESPKEEQAILIEPVRPAEPTDIVGATDAFLQEEISRFEDVKPAVKQIQSTEEVEASEDESVTKSGLFGIFSKKKDQSSPKAEKKKHKKHKKSDSADSEKVGFLEKIGRRISSTASETRDSFDEQTDKAVKQIEEKADVIEKQTKTELEQEQQQIKESIQELEKSAKEIKEDVDKKSSGFFSKLGDKISGKSQEAKETVKEAKDKIKDKSDKTIEITKEKQDTLKDALQSTEKQISKTADDLGTEVVAKSEEVKDSVRDTSRSIKDEISEKFDTILAESKQALLAAEEETAKKAADVKDAAERTKDELESKTQETVKLIEMESTQALEARAKDIKQTSEEVKDTISDAKDLLSKTKDEIKTDIKTTADLTETKLEETKEKVVGGVHDLKEQTDTVTDEVASKAKTTTEKVAKDVKAESEKVAQKSGSFFGKLGDKISGKTQKAKDGVKESKGKIKDKAVQGKESAKEIKDEFAQKSSDVTASIKEGATTVAEDLEKAGRKSGGFFSRLGDKISGKSLDLKEDMADTKDQGTYKVIETTATIKEATSEATKELTDAALDKTEKIEDKADQAKEAVDEASGMAKTLFKGMTVEFDQKVQDIKDIVEKGIIESTDETKPVDKIKDVPEAKDIATDSSEKIKGIEDTKESQELEEDIKGALQPIKEFFTEITDETEEIFEDAIDVSEQKTLEMKDDAKETLLNLEAATKDLTKQTEQLHDQTKDTKHDIMEDVDQDILTESDKIKDLLKAISNETDQKAKDLEDDAKATAQDIKQGLETTTDKIQDITSDATAKTGELTEETTKKVQQVVEHAKESPETIAAITAQKAAAVKQTTKDISSSAKEATDKAAEKTGGFFNKLGSKIGGKTKKPKDKVKQKTATVSEGTTQAIKNAKEELGQSAGSAKQKTDATAKEIKKRASDVKDAASAGAKKAKEESKKAARRSGGFFNKLGESISGKSQELKEDIKDAQDVAKDAAKDVKDKTKHRTSKAGKEAKQAAEQAADTVKTGIDDAAIKTSDFLGGLGTAVTEKAEEVTETTKDAKDKLKEDTSKIAKDAKEEAKESAEAVKTDIKDAANKTGAIFADLGSAITGKARDVADTAKDVKEELKDETSKTAIETKEAAKEGADTVKTGIEDAASKTGGFFSGLGSAIGGKAQDAADSAKVAKDKVKGGTSKAAKDATVAAKESTDTVKTGIDDAASKSSGFFSGLGSAISGKVHGVADTAKDAKKKIKGETSKASKDTKKAAKDGAHSVKAGIDDAATKSDSLFGRVGDKVSGKAQGGVGKASADFLQKEIEDSWRGGEALAGEPHVKVCKSGKGGILGAKSGPQRAPDSVRKYEDKSRDDAEVGVKPDECIKSSITRTASDNVGVGKSRGLEESARISEKDLDLSRLPSTESYLRELDVKESELTDMGDYMVRLDQDEEGFVMVPSLSLSERTGKKPIQITDLDAEEDLSGVELSQQPQRKPLFHLESEDDLLDDSTGQEEKRDSVKSNILEALTEQEFDYLIKQTEAQARDLDELVSKASSDGRDEVPLDVKLDLKSDVDAIEKKLEDLDKALGSLEKADLELSEKHDEDEGKTEKKLKRVERKFERLASETLEQEAEEAKAKRLSTPDMEERRETDYRTIVSQLSTEELSDLQKEYSALWDDHALSSSEDKSAKTPGSQADAQELPPGEVVYMGPVNLNKDHLINKAGVEVDVIPIKRSPCPSPTPLQKIRRPSSELGYRRQDKFQEDRGSLPDLFRSKPTHSKGGILDTILQRNPDTFLSKTPEMGSAESLVSSVMSNDQQRMARSLGSTDSLSKGALTAAVVNWLNRASPAGSLEQLDHDQDMSKSIGDDSESLTSLGLLSDPKTEHTIPDILVSNGKSSRKRKEKKAKKKRMRREPCTLEQSPLGEGSGSWPTTSESVSPRSTAPFRSGREEGTSEVPSQGSSGQSGSQQRPVSDQHQLSEEMKQLLKEMEEDSRK